MLVSPFLCWHSRYDHRQPEGGGGQAAGSRPVHAEGPGGNTFPQSLLRCALVGGLPAAADKLLREKDQYVMKALVALNMEITAVVPLVTDQVLKRDCKATTEIELNIEISSLRFPIFCRQLLTKIGSCVMH